MYSLYFVRSNKEKVLVKSGFENSEEVFSLISEFVHERNPSFKIYYVRSWGNNPTNYDVGSHTEFFELYED